MRVISINVGASTRRDIWPGCGQLQIEAVEPFGRHGGIGGAGAGRRAASGYRSRLATQPLKSDFRI